VNRDLRIVAVALFTLALGEGLFYGLVTLHLEELGGTPVVIGVVMALSALAQAVVMIPAGLATDRWGARQVMLSAWVAALLAVVLMALAGSLWLFAAGWLIYGLTSWVIPALTTYVTNGRGALAPERALARVFATYSAGMILSPALGGLIGERFGLQAAFQAAVVFILASTVAVTFAARDFPRPVSFRGRYTTLARNRPYLLLMVLIFVIMLAFWLGLPLAPNYLQARWGVSVGRIGMLGSAESLGGVVLALFLSRWSPQLALVGLQLSGAAYLSILLVTGQTPWLALAFFLRVGPFIGRQFVDALGTRLVPPSQFGLAFAASATVQRVANVLAAVAAGWLYKVGPALPFEAALVLVPIALLLTWLLAPRIATTEETLPTSGKPAEA
jgi:DHA1 family tetracycline resistance protein-like MFS transporter